MDDMLELVQLEDLSGNSRELAEVVGMDAFRKLVKAYGGTSWMYVPKADSVIIPARDALIRREYDGTNARQLANKWNLSERYILEIVKEERTALRQKPIDGQISLFG